MNNLRDEKNKVMKANEIQIGDWLYYKGQFNAFPFKVESITKKKVGYHAEPGDNRIYYIELNEVQPIHLTPEILEKNGFKKFNFLNIEGQHEWTWWEDTLTNVSLWCRELDDKVDDGWMVRIESPISSLCVKVEFLHELQHALRLCEIEKEIIL